MPAQIGKTVRQLRKIRKHKKDFIWLIVFVLTLHNLQNYIADTHNFYTYSNNTNQW